MNMISVIVFAGTFAVAALLLIAGFRPRPAGARIDVMAPRSERTHPTSDVRKVVKYSAIPWMNRLLQKMELAPRLRMLIYQAQMKWTVGQLMLMCLASGVLPYYLVLLRTGLVLPSLAIGVAAAFTPFGFLMLRRKARFARFDAELPKSLDLMVSALRAGHSFNAALELAAREGAEPVRSELSLCFGEQYYGLDLRDAMANLMTRVPLKDLRIVVTVVLVQKETGGNLAEVLSNTAEVIRERGRLKRQMLVHTAQGRLTGWIIGLLPVVLLILLYTINPRLESLLWKRELGLKLLYCGAAMMVVGGFLIRKIVRLDV
jgi:tight adherence protein B